MLSVSKKRRSLRVAISLLFLTICMPRALCLWPMPKIYNPGSSALRLSQNFTIQPTNFTVPQDLQNAMDRTLDRLRYDKMTRLVQGGGSGDQEVIAGANVLSSLTIALVDYSISEPDPIAVEAVKQLGARNEHYDLNITRDDPTAVLVANTTLGLLRGLATFEQMWYVYENETYMLQAPVHINDSPAYPYRGFMLDTARNFFPVHDIQRTLDAMSWVKMNMFHWHITDAQSYPLKGPIYPDLAEGAYSSSEIYTTDDVKKVLKYANERGIDVLIEIDTPGHTDAIAASHPEHIACHAASPWIGNASEPPAGQLRIASSDTTKFAVDILSSIANITTSSLFSTGGDEINEKCYDNDQPTQDDLKKTSQTIEQALDAFTHATHDALHDLNKTVVVWQDLLLEYNVNLQANTIVMVWNSSDDNISSVLGKNYSIIHAPSDYFYLDCGAGSSLGNDVDGKSWCDPFKSWQKAYSFDPLRGIPSEHTSLVLGGEQVLWTEQSGPENLEPIVWPRAAASAEVFWTGATRNVSSALQRLHDLRFRMVQRGIHATPLQPKWCALNPGSCDRGA